MALVPFREMARDAELYGYALGYFETWDIQSLLAVVKAAEDCRSPVIIGFSGFYLPDVCSQDMRWLRLYGHAGRAAAEAAEVPVSFIFNESPYYDWVSASMEYGFNLIMYSDDNLSRDELIERISYLVKKAHTLGIAVEAEAGEPPNAPWARGKGGPLTDPKEAAQFVEETGVDAIGVVVGNQHAYDDKKVFLDIELIRKLRILIDVPLVLHAGTSIEDNSLKEGIKAGIRKVNIGTTIKKPAFYSIQGRAHKVGREYPGYEVLGTGSETDILGEVGSVVYNEVVSKLRLFGSSGRA